jgi:hypothetical protein
LYDWCLIVAYKSKKTVWRSLILHLCPPFWKKCEFKC